MNSKYLDLNYKKLDFNVCLNLQNLHACNS